MDRMVKFLEIPTRDFDRAATFYKAVFDMDIFVTEMLGYKLGFLRKGSEDMWVALVNGSDYTPAAEGVLAYLNAGSEIQTTLNKVQQHNGTVLTPKMLVNEDIGYIGIFIDTEGNKIGVHAEQ